MRISALLQKVWLPGQDMDDLLLSPENPLFGPYGPFFLPLLT
ncbi:MAG: hypothetical protein KatS3mg015_2442 [Fimbriimonadales bacterium]|nr:MAG: hypothetical protein KatS3mg015_2442 [Fimbriimonadales bacterium]